MSDSRSFSGNPEHLETWQAVHQAIGFLRGSHAPGWIIEGLQRAGEILNQPVKLPQLDRPIKAEFTLLPPPADHRLVRRELPLDLSEDSYLRGVALDWPEGRGPRIVWEWSEPVTQVRDVE